MNYRQLASGIGEAVAKRTILRKKANGHLENWGNVAERVATGNALLSKNFASRLDNVKEHIEQEQKLLEKHIANATLLMSGRHLQHGDETQPARNQEVYTNCSTAGSSFLLFYLLMNGSGVGRAYDDDLMLTNWSKNLPQIKVVLDESHKDFDYMHMESLREATRKYKHAMWFEVPDTREGWAKAVEQLEVLTYEGKNKDKVFVIDFSKVRASGTPIKGMQDRPASGPAPLMRAFTNIATLKGSDMENWESTLWVDHYLAECVLVGGARRSARIATKAWTDKDVIDFISVKKGGFLWSANNSVTVDEEFWKQDTEQKKTIFNEILKASYYDGTGEPGFINQHKLVQKDVGLEIYKKDDFIGSQKYQLDDQSKIYMRKVAEAVMSKKYTQITNPCGEISLHMLGGYCVRGNTRILHRHGYDNIKDLVGKEVEVFNGVRWSKATPFQTGKDQELLRVSFSDGSYLDCTDYHKFSIKKWRQGNSFQEVEAKELQIGDILPTFRIPENIDGEHLEDAYTYGAFLGDGGFYFRNGKTRFDISLYGEKHNLPISGNKDVKEHSSGALKVNLSHLDSQKLIELKSEELPDWLYQLDKKSTVDFILGWVDTDGCYSSGTGGITITAANENRIRGLQLLLRRIGLSYASVSLVVKEGEINNYGPRKKDLWKIYIPSSEAGLLQGYRVQSDYPIDLERVVKQQRVVSVERLSGKHDTFCFEEPERHMGVFNNVLTHQCVIADVVPYFANNDEDAEEAFRAVTRALIRVNTMDSLYNDEVNRTNRIGVGLTGLHEYAWKRFGHSFTDLIDEEKSKDFWMMISRFKRAVDDEAERYSVKIGVNVPHTNTTIKPAGTTSKLFALSEGAHLPAMLEYLRWVQFRSDDPLVKEYEKKGYPTKELKTYRGSTVVGFPTQPEICKLGMGEKLITAGDATPEQQYQWLMLLEKYWIHGVDEDGKLLISDTGNQVSYTLKYKPDIVDFDLYGKTVLEYQSQIRCCSVMPQVDATAYEYQPEQPITRSYYNQLVRHIEYNGLKEDVDRVHVDCDGGACPVDFYK